jgi:hypothetical protein
MVLVETGGTMGPGNLALGGTAFAKDVIFGGSLSQHQIAHLNDGIYGNSNSWIGDSDPSFSGINLGGLVTVGQIAWGSDNQNVFSDRSLGTYTVQVTTVAAPSAATPDVDWTTIDTLTYDGVSPDATPHLRHRYTFPAVAATGVRLVNDPPGGFDYGTVIRIDELEIYAPVPEPSSFALGALGLLGLAGYGWRRKSSPILASSPKS